MNSSLDVIETRKVFFFGGYEHASADEQYQRLARESVRFQTTWNIRATIGTPQRQELAHIRAWPIVAQGPNWRTSTEFHYCAWNDLIQEDFARPFWQTLPAGLWALGDFIATGTVYRYFRVAWRYGLFFTYAVLVTLLLAGFAALLATAASAIAGPIPTIVEFGAVLVLFCVLVLWPGSRLHLPYMLNDWSFARAIARGSRASYSQRIADFADAMRNEITKNDADEIVIVGHSLGAVLAVESLAKAIGDDAKRDRRATPITLMTVGSSLLKVGLHPAANDLRQAVSHMLAYDDVTWIDYTALVDPLNFYRCEPGTVLKLGAPREAIVRTAKIRAMLGEPGYQKFKGNFLRLHRQFVMGNGARYHYDFFMSCCGPMSQASRISNPTLAVENFAEDGTYLPGLEHDCTTVRAATGT